MSNQHLLRLTIARVDAPIFDGDVISVVVPGVDGEMTILAHHKALLSPLKSGSVTITVADGTKEVHETTGGTLEISNNHATILL